MKLSDLLGIQRKVLNVSGGCHNCPRKRQRFCGPDLRPAPFIIVGEAPFDNDVEAQVPFSGQTGSLLRQELALNGLYDYATTNTIHCQPDRNSEGQQNEPTDKETSCCMNQFTINEIENYPIVLLVGNHTQRSFFPKMRTSHLRGNVAYHPDFPGKRFYSIRSPINIVQRRQDDPEVEQWKKEIKRFAEIVRGEPVQWRVIQGGSDFLTRLQFMLGNTNQISLDLETTELKHWEPNERIRSFAVAANKSEAFFAHEGEAHFWPALEMIKNFLLNKRNRVMGAHVGFDVKWLERMLDFVAMCEVIFDVNVLYYHIKQYKQTSLKELVSREGNGYRFLVYQPHLERDLNILSYYNAEDVIQVLDLHERGMQQLVHWPKTLDLYLRVGGPSDLALERIRYNGFALRHEYHAALRQELETKRNGIIEHWRTVDPDFRPVHTSGKDLEHYLFTMKQFPVLKTTTKGPSTDESSLKELMRQGHGKQIIQCLLDLREVEKELGTYVIPYLELVGSDGRIHSNYNNTSTDTGRTSSNEPNMQNVPRPKRIRDLFGVPEGYTLLQSDFSQIELRIAMCLARDEAGIAAYLRGEDLHTNTARVVAGGSGEPTKEQRTHAKILNFSLVYGGTAYTIRNYAQNLYGIIMSAQQSEDYCDLFFSTYPGLKRWHDECNRLLVQNQGWSEHAVGHRFFYKDWNSEHQGTRDHAFRAHINSKGQGPAGYMAIYTLILAQRAFHERGIDARTVGTVHDSILTEVRRGSEADAIAALNDCVQKVHRWVSDWFVVPLIMDHEVGPAWGSLEKWKN